MYRSGGDFTPDHVARLCAALDRYLPGVPLTCLTDRPNEVQADRVVRLATDLPGWWAKMELFRPGLFREGVLYLDLDTVIVGPLDFMNDWAGRTTCLSDFYRPLDVATGALLWTGDALSEAWRRFDPVADMGRFRLDHAMRQWLQGAARVQDMWPGRFVSYKAHCRDRIVPPAARVVCFHGKPRPQDLPKTSPLHQAWAA